MNPLETIMEILPFLNDDELKAVTDFVAQRRRANQPVTDKPKRYPYVFVCAGCHLLAHSERADTITCSPACRVKLSSTGPDVPTNTTKSEPDHHRAPSPTQLRNTKCTKQRKQSTP